MQSIYHRLGREQAVTNKKVIEKELEEFGIRINKEPRILKNEGEGASSLTTILPQFKRIIKDFFNDLESVSGNDITIHLSRRRIKVGSASPTASTVEGGRRRTWHPYQQRVPEYAFQEKGEDRTSISNPVPQEFISFFVQVMSFHPINY